jgi:hypothetical protein
METSDMLLVVSTLLDRYQIDPDKARELVERNDQILARSRTALQAAARIARVAKLAPNHNDDDL